MTEFSYRVSEYFILCLQPQTSKLLTAAGSVLRPFACPVKFRRTAQRIYPGRFTHSSIPEDSAVYPACPVKREACLTGMKSFFALISSGFRSGKGNKKDPSRSSRLGGSKNSKFKTKNYQIVNIRGGYLKKVSNDPKTPNDNHK